MSIITIYSLGVLHHVGMHLINEFIVISHLHLCVSLESLYIVIGQTRPAGQTMFGK